MGTDIHAFIECADPFRALPFSGTPDYPAYQLGSFSLLRDYELFDALGDGRNSLMSPKEVDKRALIPPGGVPPDISLQVAQEYYDLVVERDLPSRGFWPRHGCVSLEEARPRLKEGRGSRKVSRFTELRSGAVLWLMGSARGGSWPKRIGTRRAG